MSRAILPGRQTPVDKKRKLMICLDMDVMVDCPAERQIHESGYTSPGAKIQTFGKAGGIRKQEPEVFVFFSPRGSAEAGLACQKEYLTACWRGDYK
jgi:hypothetical protein